MNEEKILEWKALTMTKGMFKQLREVREAEYREWILQVGCKGIDPLAVINWIGYVLEPISSSAGELQITWFLYEACGTICRIRETELFFIVRRTSQDAHPTLDLRDLLKQIFVKAW